MPAPRRNRAEQLALAVDDLVRLAGRLPHVELTPLAPDGVEVRPARGRRRRAKVVAYDAVGESKANHLLATEARGTIVVADRISEPARQRLSAAGWGWLDRRVGAHLALPGRDVEVVFDGDGDGGADAPRHDTGGELLRTTAPAADGPIRGRAGLAYAAALLCAPHRPPSFRSVAAAVGMSPTAISNAVQRLTEAGLVGAGNEPTVPELFWTLAEVWGPTRAVAVRLLPDRVADDDLDGPGWVLGGDQAATELGAPVFAPESRPWLWVPTPVELRRAERRYERCSWSDRAAVLAVPPTPLVSQGRRAPRPDGTAWPLPHPVFAALDLARDPGRGREILDQWSPEGVDVVWR